MAYWPDILIGPETSTSQIGKSQDWNACLSYDAEGMLVEMVILDAKAIGAWPIEEQRHAA